VCDPVTIAAASLAVATVGTGAAIYQGSESAAAQSRAADQAAKNAADTKAANERAINAANQKSPDLAAIAASNKALASGGVGSTMLTGPTGVAAGSLDLGKNTLLGR
jgi:hypothetical protein